MLATFPFHHRLLDNHDDSFDDTHIMASEEEVVATANAVAAPTLATFTLDNILSHQHDKIENSHAEGWDEETADKPPTQGYCVECEGQLRPTIKSSSN